ncbi:MAG: nucleotidyltransferase family protein [Acidobacteria bacterium]|nr:nucleotidyltransferase family protein [Acidobacteriota bacterium]
MESKQQILQLLEKNRERIKSFGVTKLGIFGSAARDEQNAGSDVDVLVELEEETFDSYMGLLFFLEELFGRKVDLAIKDSIKPRIKDRILSETIYVEGL